MTLHEITTPGLTENGWITDWNAPGVVGFTKQFEDVLDGVQRMIYATETVSKRDTLNFPPVIARSVIDTTEYADSFPHLLARIKTLDEDDAPKYLKGIADGTPEDEMLETSDVVVVPAACYTPLSAGRRRQGRVRQDVLRRRQLLPRRGLHRDRPLPLIPDARVRLLRHAR